MSEQPPDTPTASDADVITVLGKIGPRVQATEGINVPEHYAIGHAEAATLLARTYPRQVPTFRGPAAEVVRWAVAKLAAARILDILRASLDTVSETPERLRASAQADLTGPLPGYPAGSDLDNDGQPLPTPPGSDGPRVGFDAPGSLFPDPYPWGW